MKGKRIMAIGAHPDDVEIGCGGLLMAENSKESEIMIVDLTFGEMASNGTADIRKIESENAAMFLNSKRNNLNIGDRQIELNFENRCKLAREIRLFKPDIILIPYGKDRHPDHVATHKLAIESIFDAKIRKIDLDNLEPHSIDKIIQYYINDIEQVNAVYDISDYYDKKDILLRCHESQFILSEEKYNTILNGSYLNDLELRAKYFGGLAGCIYGEPLHIDKLPLIDCL